MDITKAGRFRANPNASKFNALRLLDEGTPGTPLEDTATIDMTSAVEATGIKYTGKDGQSQTLLFGKTIHKTHDRINQPVAKSQGAEALRDAILEVVEQHEVDPIVSVTVAGQNWTVLHIGSGSVTALIVDGSDSALSRGAISTSGLDVQVEDVAEEATEETAEVSAEVTE